MKIWPLCDPWLYGRPGHSPALDAELTRQQLEHVLLPTAVVKCRSCSGQLRGRIVGAETLIVCDHCEYFTAAPSTHRQMIDDLIGQRLLARSN